MNSARIPIFARSSASGLGLQEVKELPPEVTLEVVGKVAQARVLDRRAFISYGYQTPRDLSLYLEGV